jgi:hypothetical protein
MTTLPDYEVVPLALLDSTHLNFDIVIEFSMFFKEQLCFEKLEQSWTTLNQAWPILSARVRKDPSSPSGFVYHVPTVEGLANIRQRELEKDVKERQFYCLDEGHRSASTFSPALKYSDQQPNEIFTVEGPSIEEHEKIVTANATRTTDEMLVTDRPLVSVQVSRFNDGTLISLCESHVIGDCFGVKAIVVAWQNILAGNGPPLPVQDLGMDPFAPLGPNNFKHEKKPAVSLGVTLYSFRQKMRLFYNYLYDFYVTRPEKTFQQRYVFIPNEELERLQASVKLDLAHKAAREGKETAETVSKFNILYAWAMQHSHAGLPKSKTSTPLCIYNVKRDKPAGVDVYPRHDFWGGAYAVPMESQSVEALLDMPLGELALYFRKSLEKHRTPQESANVIKCLVKYSSKNTKTPGVPFFGGPNHYFTGLTDWRVMKWWQTDFKGAVMGDDTKSAPLLNVQAQMNISMSKRDRWVLIGDSKNGFWMTGGITRNDWNHPDGFGQYTEMY